MPHGLQPRVLWWLNEFPPDQGGIATIAGLLQAALDDAGTPLSILVTQGGPSQERVGGSELVRQPIWADFHRADVRTQMRWLPLVRELKERVAADVYHVHLCEPSPILHVLTLSSHPAPTILTIHNEKLSASGLSGSGNLFGRLLDLSPVVISVSVAAAEALLAARPDLGDRMVVIPNGIAVGEPPAPVPAAPEILAVGRIVPQKGFDTLLRAMPAVARRVPDVRLTVAGEGTERAALEALAVDLGVAANVHFTGQVSRAEVRDLMTAARVVVMPSRIEGMPLVALEAAERGRAVVGTDIGGINEVVVEGATGLLVDGQVLETDCAPLAGAIVRALTEPGLAERLGGGARQRVADHFSIEECAQAHQVVYRQVGARTPAPRVSVIMPAWNASAHIEQAIGSVLDQPFADLELIVVDDGSDDDTVARARAVDDPRVIVLRQPHRDCSAARNAGIAIARGEFHAHIDADDLWPSDRLLALVAAMDADPALEACFGLGVEFADADAPAHAQVQTEPQRVRMPTTGLVRAACSRRIGPFHGSTGDQLDWSMRALAQNLAYGQIDEVVLLRRIHASNKSHGRPFATDRSRVALLKNALDLRARRAGAAGPPPE